MLELTRIVDVGPAIGVGGSNRRLSPQGAPPFPASLEPSGPTPAPKSPVPQPASTNATNAIDRLPSVILIGPPRARSGAEYSWVANSPSRRRDHRRTAVWCTCDQGSRREAPRCLQG